MNESLGRGATLTSGIKIKISCVGEVTEENLKKIAKPDGKIIFLTQNIYIYIY